MGGTLEVHGGGGVHEKSIRGPRGSMEGPRDVHGRSTGDPREVHERSTGCPREVHGRSTGGPQEVHGRTGCPRISRGGPGDVVGLLRHCHTFSVMRASIKQFFKQPKLIELQQRTIFSAKNK